MFRKMRRNATQITDEECIKLLKEAKRGVLAVLGDEGYPYTVPLNFVYSDGHIYFHSAKAGHKLDAIRQHDKVSFCVLNDGIREENDWWYHFTSVIAFGRIREIESEDERDRYLRLLGRKYFPSEDILEKEMENAPITAVLDMEIEHVTGKTVREK